MKPNERNFLIIKKPHIPIVNENGGSGARSCCQPLIIVVINLMRRSMMHFSYFKPTLIVVLVDDDVDAQICESFFSASARSLLRWPSILSTGKLPVCAPCWRRSFVICRFVRSTARSNTEKPSSFNALTFKCFCSRRIFSCSNWFASTHSNNATIKIRKNLCPRVNA